jgi:prophage maintenance system killer protein
VTRYLTAAQIVAINADQGGTLNDANGVQAAAHRPQSTVFGDDLFAGLWSKAAAYLHSFATTQYFSDGNKRTAWYAAATFLQLNDHPLPDVDAIDAEVLVHAAARDVFATGDEPNLTIAKVAEWLRRKREHQRVGVCRDRRLEYALLARAGHIVAGSLLDLQHALLIGLAEETFPCRVDFCLVGRIHWDREEVQHPHAITVTVRPPSGGPDVTNHTETTRVPAYYSPPSGHPAHARTGRLPMDLYVELAPIIPAAGRYTVAVQIDGKPGAELPLEIRPRGDLRLDEAALDELTNG